MASNPFEEWPTESAEAYEEAERELSQWLSEISSVQGSIFLDLEPRPVEPQLSRKRHYTDDTSSTESICSDATEEADAESCCRSVSSVGRGPTAMDIFRQFTKVFYDECGNQHMNVSGIISRECYEAWLGSRKTPPKRPEECFRKCILAHCTATDGGSAPFSEPVEAAILNLLRKRDSVWPCFDGYVDGTGTPIRIGLKGLRATGYHEKSRLEASGHLSPPSCSLKRRKND